MTRQETWQRLVALGQVSGAMPNSRWPLKEITLTGALLRGANLREAMLKGSTLDDADLSGANLREANLSNTSLHKALLKDAIAGGALFRQANMSEAILSGADLSKADFNSAVMMDANLIKADLYKANLFEADLSGANLTEANLDKASLTNASLIEAECTEADFSNADLTGATLRKTDFNRATFTEALLREADLTGADFTVADLTGANLQRAGLSDGVFAGANFSKATLKKADALRGNFTGASFCGADLSGVDFTGADLSGADFTGAFIFGANFTNANLSRALLRDAFVFKTNFTNAVLQGADLTGATMWGLVTKGWKPYEVKVEYIYHTNSVMRRPEHKKPFAPGEFEFLFRKMPMIEMVFDSEMTSSVMLVVSSLVEAVSVQHPRLGLKLLGAQAQGLQSVITVCTREDGYLEETASILEDAVGEVAKGENQGINHVLNNTVTDLSHGQGEQCTAFALPLSLDLPIQEVRLIRTSGSVFTIADKYAQTISFQNPLLNLYLNNKSLLDEKIARLRPICMDAGPEATVALERIARHLYEGLPLADLAGLFEALEHELALREKPLALLQDIKSIVQNA